MSFNELITKISHTIVFISIIVAFSDALHDFNNDLSIDFNRTTPELIESRNFKSETHFVTTSDGYILQIFRIINPFLKNRTKSMKPIILQHGFCGDSDEFLISRQGYLQENGVYIEEGEVVTDCDNFSKTGKTLGFILSACGYDVWLSNIRGNKYSQNHTTIDPDRFLFWKFTMDEMGLIDLPAVINYIGVRTTNQRIGFIGYSIGSALMFELMSTHPEYSSIIDPFIAIAPIVYTSHSAMVPYYYLYPLFRTFSVPLVRSYPLRKILLKLFSKTLPAEENEVNEMAAHLKGRTSSLVSAQLLQWTTNNYFGRFNWGLFENIVRYGSGKPPDYPLSNITSNRIALIQTKNDVFSDYKDLVRLKRELKVKLLLDYWIPDQKWTHSDYLFNDNSDIYVNSVIMKLLKNE